MPFLLLYALAITIYCIINTHLGSGVVEIRGEARGPSSLATSIELVAFLQSVKYCALSAPGGMEQRKRAVVPTLAKKVCSLFGARNRSG